MVKKKIKKKLDCTIITHKIEKNEQLNFTELDLIRKGDILSLEPVEIYKGIVGNKICFTITGYIDLTSYLRSNITFDTFLDIIFQILSVVRSCETHGVRVSNLDLESDCIFYDSAKKQIHMLYWPLLSLREYADTKSFFRSLGDLYICSSTDEPFKKSYLNCFEQRAKFNLIHLEERLRQLKRNWNDSQDTGYTEEQVVSLSTDATADSDNAYFDVTVSLSEPILIRESTKTRITVKHLPFKIGRRPDLCDYALTDDCLVSKVHFIVKRDGTSYYITDHNSTNGTKINGERIPQNEDVMIKSGDRISIGSECFVFLNVVTD